VSPVRGVWLLAFVMAMSIAAVCEASVPGLGVRLPPRVRYAMSTRPAAHAAPVHQPGQLPQASAHQAFDLIERATTGRGLRPYQAKVAFDLDGTLWTPKEGTKDIARAFVDYMTEDGGRRLKPQAVSFLKEIARHNRAAMESHGLGVSELDSHGDLLRKVHRAYEKKLIEGGERHEFRAQIGAGYTKRQLRIMAHELLEREEFMDRVNPEALAALGMVARRGYQVEILSASPSFLVEAAAELLERKYGGQLVSRRNANGTDPRTTGWRRVVSTAPVKMPIPYRAGKSEQLLADGVPLVAYFGDTEGDQHALGAAVQRFVVGPKWHEAGSHESGLWPEWHAARPGSVHWMTAR
jgi:phosphoserine phosphatase